MFTYTNNSTTSPSSVPGKMMEPIWHTFLTANAQIWLGTHELWEQVHQKMGAGDCDAKSSRSLFDLLTVRNLKKVKKV